MLKVLDRYVPVLRLAFHASLTFRDILFVSSSSSSCSYLSSRIFLSPSCPQTTQQQPLLARKREGRKQDTWHSFKNVFLALSLSLPFPLLIPFHFLLFAALTSQGWIGLRRRRRTITLSVSLLFFKSRGFLGQPISLWTYIHLQMCTQVRSQIHTTMQTSCSIKWEAFQQLFLREGGRRDCDQKASLRSKAVLPVWSHFFLKILLGHFDAFCRQICLEKFQICQKKNQQFSPSGNSDPGHGRHRNALYLRSKACFLAYTVEAPENNVCQEKENKGESWFFGDTRAYPTNIVSVNLVMGCFKLFFSPILTPALTFLNTMLMI